MTGSQRLDKSKDKNKRLFLSAKPEKQREQCWVNLNGNVTREMLGIGFDYVEFSVILGHRQKKMESSIKFDQHEKMIEGHWENHNS